MSKPDITKLKTSWTKFDTVRFITIVGNDELDLYLHDEQPIDHAILKAYLGVDKLSDPIPKYWKDVITNYSQLRKMFTLLAGIFTHHENIEKFAHTYSTKNMGGTFVLTDGSKHQTNMRSALVEGGAALTSYRRKHEVPFDFSKIFAQEEIGKNFKELIAERLRRIGYDEKEVQIDTVNLAIANDFHLALGLTKPQFKTWLEGKSVSQIKEFHYDLNLLKDEYQSNTCFRVNQWLSNWDSIDYSLPMRSKPDNHFYMFKMDIRLLKRISDVHRRSTNKPRANEVNIQRNLKEDRSIEIQQYVQQGFPLSTLSEKDRLNPENDILRMPGILPTAILVNILGAGQKRGNSTINSDDLAIIDETGTDAKIILPEGAFSDTWNPELKPFEVIDGQHRLWAFDETEQINGNYEVPVVAYYNLDRAWQAYLFYVINIKPKKINTSLGYDLYPLLRTQEWLENSRDGLKVYRETRSQELVEALWSYPESPWHHRISMLGEESNNISQHAFIRALTDSYFKKSRKGISGLFSDVLRSKNEELRWVRPQQAAFLILLWDAISQALKNDAPSTDGVEWIEMVRAEKTSPSSIEKELQLDRAFTSKSSNLSRDQGVTGLMMFSNDFFYIVANEPNIDLNSLAWDNEIDERQIEAASIDIAINNFRSHPIYSYIQSFAEQVLKFDWRTSTANFLDPEKAEYQKKYRGSGGYREIWNDLLKVFLESDNKRIKSIAKQLADIN
ncbi:DGQHR domain-containing protein [Dyadobacter sp. BE34]|uniref:DGQHR domain-containing protein n=1 Tax=Dyadobacter fermentans TaxID=94254 RepID=A0ABU1R9Y7_9BACT|nr:MULTISPECIES: DGQHR domain-containing protein [Dyadobacter]MDR6809750.1 DGQHR domain-containing protein [Dyadobacter fermentans]MDR7047535.1 DGQHR domain-containing protein [Dyadobacter sp. BE242]MDR7201705.1 DGQHR domain-containing protein [Dyadobacter sp. BE34]MDR7219575.1 DGQHR domain-containing protein [Dyadobacter sp. BE31]MDR7267302.1 DGQHR domain-containing protein [Dyadobacter sp. BE32]